MKSTIFVKELNGSGRYISEPDYCEAFIGKDSPKGLFKTVVEPLDNYDGPEIFYKEVDGGYLVEGEGYVITGRSENKIDAKIRKNFTDTFERVIMTENNALD